MQILIALCVLVAGFVLAATTPFGIFNLLFIVGAAIIIVAIVR